MEPNRSYRAGRGASGVAKIPRGAGAALCAVIMLSLSVAPANAAYGPTIVGGTSSNSEHKLAWDGAGTLYATFTEPVGNTTGIAVKKSIDGGATWSFLPRLGTAEAFRSCIAVDSSGVLHIAWTEFVGPDRQVFYARWAGGPNWTGLQQISDTPGYSGFPTLDIDVHGQVHVAWYGFDGANYQVFYRFLDLQGWHPTQQATHGAQDANNPALVAPTAGAVHIAYFSYFRGDTDVWYLHGNQSGWSAPQRVNPAGVPSRDPSIAMVMDQPVIAYASGVNESLEVRLAERDAGGAWAQNTAVSQLGERGDHPALVTDGQQNIAVLYENASGAIRLRARIGGAWSAPSTLTSSGDARWVSAAFVPWGTGPAGGNVVALWTEGSAADFHIAFGKATPFPDPVPPCQCLNNALADWAVPVLFLLIAGSCVGALAIASARTRGGGRG